MTITANMTGGIGNHLAAYLITRVVADKNNYQFGFNRQQEYDPLYQQSEIDTFLDVDYGLEHNYKYAETPPWITNIYQEKYDKITYPNGDYVDFHDYQPEVFNVLNNTKIIVRSFQDARYYIGYKEKIRNWLKIKEEYVLQYNNVLKQNKIELDDDLVVMSIRGGEYKGVDVLLLRKAYWQKSMQIMLDRNPKSKFLAVSDDPDYAFNLFDGKITTIHHSVGGDHFFLRNAKNLIISNSSFAIFPVFINENNPYVIAPKFWARWNVSTGYWAASDMSYYPWHFMDREGNINENF